MKTTDEIQPRVYSYLRFSRPEQAKGDSERRQIEGAKEYAKRVGLPFDESLSMADRGLSGYRGANIKSGALGVFLKKVEQGEIPRGSILVVENVDRISRMEFFDAFKVISGLITSGIIIQTLSPEMSYDERAAKDGRIYMLIGQINLAHEESDKKAGRLQKKWKEKKEKARSEKTPITKRVPAWLKIVDGKFQIIPEAGQTLTRIFNLYQQGLSVSKITAKLNEESSWSANSRKRKTEGWHGSYVMKILRNRSVIGEYQPHEYDKERKRQPVGEPINDYFPAVVDPTLFHAVQRRLDEAAKLSHHGGGRTGKARNLFPHLVKCPYCSGSMVYVDKGPGSKGGRYLVCDHGQRGPRDEDGNRICKRHWVHYDEAQDLILSNCRQLRPEDVLPHEDERQEVVQQLRLRVHGLDSQIADTERQQKNLVDQIGKTDDAEMRDSYEERVKELRGLHQTLLSDKSEAEAKLRDAERGREDFTAWKKDLATLIEALKSDDPEIRLKTQSHLRQFIDRIEIFADGDQVNVERAEELIDEFAPEMRKADSFALFQKYLRKRLLSREGRFYRIIFKERVRTKKVRRRIGANEYQEETVTERIQPKIDVAPTESLAASRSMMRKEDDGSYSVAFRGVDVDAILKDFFDGRKPDQYAPKDAIIKCLSGL